MTRLVESRVPAAQTSKAEVATRIAEDSSSRSRSTRRGDAAHRRGEAGASWATRTGEALATFAEEV